MTDSKAEYDAGSMTKEEVIDIASLKHMSEEEENSVAYSAEERRLVRKLDYIYVMPFIAILNFLQVRYSS